MEPLVVTRRRQRHSARIGADGEHAHLGPVEEVLHHDRALGQPLCRPPRCFVSVLGHQDTLAGSEAIGLYDERAITTGEIVAGRVGIVEGLRSCGCHAGSGHDLLGERLRRLQAGRGPGRPEDGDAEGGHRIDDAGSERRFWAYHDQVHRLDPGHRRNRPDVGYRNPVHDGSEPAETRVARKGDEVVHPG